MPVRKPEALTERIFDHRKNATRYVRARINYIVKNYGVLFFGFSLLMRLPTAMLALALLLLVSSRTGEITLGGYGAGAILLSSAIAVPAYQALANRFSRRIVFFVSVSLNIPAIAFLLTQTYRFSPAEIPDSTSTYFIAAILAGITTAPVGALMRSLWSEHFKKTGDRKMLNSTIAIESIFDVFALPIAAALTGFIAIFNVLWAVIAVIVIDAIGLILILWIPFTFPSLSHRPQRSFRTLSQVKEGTASMRWLPLAGIACLGALLGSIESALAAFTVSTNSIGTVGFYLTALGIAGTLLGILLVYYRVSFSSWSSWMITGAMLILSSMLVSIFSSEIALGFALAFLGAALGISLICMDSAATYLSARHNLEITLASLQSTYVGGLALGLVWGAILGQRFGYQAALLIPLLASVLFFLLGHLYGYRWRRQFEERLELLP